MKAATPFSPRSGGHTGKDGRDISVFDFDEKDPRPFRDKKNSRAMFGKAFGSKGNHTLKCGSISVRHDKCTRGAKATNRKNQGQKFTQKWSCQQVATDQEAVSQEFLSCSDKIQTDDSDSVSEGEVSRPWTLKKEDVVETLRSLRGATEVSISEKVTEVIITGEALLLSDVVCKCSPRFTFSIDAIALTIPNCHSDSAVIKWPLKEISSFGSYTCQSGFVMFKLGFTHLGAEVFVNMLKELVPFDKDGCTDHCLTAVIKDADWEEHQRQITSLSDAYKGLWRPLKVEGTLNSGEEDGLTSQAEEGREGTLNSGEEDGLTSQAEEGRCDARLRGLFDTVSQNRDHDAVTVKKTNFQNGNCEVMLQEWFDIVYPKGDHDAVTVTKNDFLLLSPEEFLSDTIIDFYIKHLQSTLSEHDKNRFYFFNSFFFRKLTEGENSVFNEPEKHKYAFERVKRWTAKVNIFEKEYLFIPIMQSAHWSLIVICQPGFVSTEFDEASTCKVPVILHFDSLEGCHTGLEEPVQNYLMEAWIQKYGCTGDRNSLCCKRLSEVKFMSAKVPQQTNYSDCGLFLLHYVELFIRSVHNESPTEFVKGGWFDPADASNKRIELQSLIIRLHAMELPDRCLKIDLPENLALDVKNKKVTINDAQAIHETVALRLRDSMSGSKASELVYDGPVGPMGRTIHLDGLHVENQMFMGIFDTYDHHEQKGLKGEADHYSHPDLVVPVSAHEFQGNLCSCQLQDSFSPRKKVFLFCPAHAPEAANNYLHSTMQGNNSAMSEQASVSIVCFDANTNSGHFSVNSSRECMHAYDVSNSCYDHGQKIVQVPNMVFSSHGVLRFGECELHDCSKEIFAIGIQSGSTVDDETDKSPIGSKQMDLAMEYEMEDIKFSKFTTERGLENSGSISDTDKEEANLFTLRESTVEESRHTLSSSALKEQNMVIHSNMASDDQSEDEPPVNRNSKEDEFLQNKDKICKDVDSECIISNCCNPHTLQEEHLWHKDLDKKHEICPPSIQDTLRVANTQYISSDEEPCRPQYQTGLDHDVGKMLEAVNLRKSRKRKVAEGSKALQGWRPVTRTKEKRGNVRKGRSASAGKKK